MRDHKVAQPPYKLFNSLAEWSDKVSCRGNVRHKRTQNTQTAFKRSPMTSSSRGAPSLDGTSLPSCFPRNVFVRQKAEWWSFSLALCLFCFCFVFVFLVLSKPRPFAQSFLDMHAPRQPHATTQQLSMSSFVLFLKRCRFFRVPLPCFSYY